MKPTSIAMKCATAALLVSAVWAGPLQVRAAENRVPLIVIDKVPLTDAIRNLARQAGFNFILDPHVPGSGFAASKPVTEPSITMRWENVTAQQALSALLAGHNLMMVTNPATTVTRIAPADQKVSPVPASRVASDTNAPIPLVVMDQVPLQEAIRQLAGQLHLSVLFDPKLSAPAFERDGLISIRWENITARQALAAILDNYGLVMEENPSASSARITASPTTAPPRSEEK